jgi:hypothetical protein
MQFFRYDHESQNRTSAKPTLRVSHVKPEFVYKELAKHTKYELEDIRLPDKPNYNKDSTRYSQHGGGNGNKKMGR